MIGKNLRIKGELSGAEPITIAGSIIGSISFAGNPVTVGADADVMAQITAGNLTVIGKVRGNVKAEDRHEIRAGGSLLGESSRSAFASKMEHSCKEAFIYRKRRRKLCMPQRRLEKLNAPIAFIASQAHLSPDQGGRRIEMAA